MKSLDDLELITLLVFLAITAAGIVAAVVHYEARRKRRNIRVPRETLWERTNRYHGASK